MGKCEYCCIGSYSENCQCTKFNDTCPFVRRCSDRHIWVPLTTMDKCTRRTQTVFRREDVELKDGEYIVEYAQNGKLYVNVDGNLFKMTNPFKDETPHKVKLKRVDNEMVIVVDEEEKKEEPKVDYKKSKKKK